VHRSSGLRERVENENRLISLQKVRYIVTVGEIFKKNCAMRRSPSPTLASLIPPEINAEIQVIDEGIEDVDLNLNADLIGMTVITGSSMRAYELAGHFRNRGIPVVLGGPHITTHP